MNKNWLNLWLWWTNKRHPDMEHFSDTSKICFARANQIASNNDSTYINSIHLIKAILQTPISESIDPDGKLADAIEGLDAKEQLSHSEGLKKAVENSIEFARELGNKEITPLLLLHGISQMPQTEGAQAMAAQDITTEKLEALIRKH